MGDIGQDNLLEQNRLKTYEGHSFNIDSLILARAGFYYTNKGSILECCECHLQIDTVNLDPDEDIIILHKEKKPECTFAQSLSRSKKFDSYTSLRFEKERLETFIEWPVEWLKPTDLSHDGFYYLRTADHCACVFCQGIVGAWEVGDIPRREHQRHFPHCPFIQGKPVGNISLTHCELLSKLSLRTQQMADERPIGSDVCGGLRHMTGSFAEYSGPPKKSGISIDEMGLPQHSGPKKKDFLTYESRLVSFARWPERIKQKPNELSEAGFFYCGLSDHVRCFHCGNGLRNWESEDIPWNEHARWYPECNFILLKKGQEFIDKVRREKPPYIRIQPTTINTPTIATIKPISENELNPLMELDIIRGVLEMGFPQDKVRLALRQKLEQTGLPFLNLPSCIEEILKCMEEEIRQILHQASSQEIKPEATVSPSSSISNSLSISSSSSTSMSIISTSSVVSLASVTTSTSISVSSSSNASTTSAVVSLASVTTSTSAAISSSSNANTTTSVTTSTSAPIPTVCVSFFSRVPVPASTSSLPISLETRQPPLVFTNNSLTVSPALTTTHEEIETDDNVADEIMEMEEIKVRPASGEKMFGEPSTSGLTMKESNVTTPQSSQELVDELKRIRDIRMCKVCMDTEMDVVFLPCQHMVTCSSCALALAQCPICREDIKYTVKPILS